ncbi:hypothetical protein BUALT_Bualt15G0063600 [Buddleja alternifolia]|uniref:DUF7870 domain-containing protein n=1 Tax=Buddleja alternifolia TaxID=168488 RepID=A0AAV6WEJ1_9LAMI|nr:hypothetical protein BUALT_Bualt15G0063600 [Buddleja alternifolia]
MKLSPSAAPRKSEAIVLLSWVETTPPPDFAVAKFSLRRRVRIASLSEMSKLARGYRSKNGGYNVNELNRLGIGLNSHALLIIRLPDSRALRIISRSLFLAMILLALPSIGSIILGAASSNAPLYQPGASGLKVPSILLRDLVDEGLIRKGHRGLVPNDSEGEFEFMRDAGIDLLTGADLRKKEVNEDRLLFDFVFATSLNGITLIDSVLKDGGLVIYSLGHDSSDELRLLRNFKIVYLRRFEDTIVAMRKSKASQNVNNPTANQVSCGVTPEKKMVALKGLEDVYLEPPREANQKSSFTSRKIKFLPDLLDDSLDEYQRRVFISDDSRAVDWFYKNYPMRDQEFDVYDLEYGNDGPLQGVSSWITKNVRRDDYVVMKAEAEVVEEMLKDKSLCLVDELFLECKNQWEDGEEEENGSKRAYWQCLELYGKVRDEGVAVHQWWY